MRKKKMKEEIANLNEARAMDLAMYKKMSHQMEERNLELESRIRRSDSALTDCLERAADQLVSDTWNDVEHWRSEYWLMKDEYDQMVDKLEELVRNYCG